MIKMKMMSGLVALVLSLLVLTGPCTAARYCSCQSFNEQGQCTVWHCIGS